MGLREAASCFVIFLLSVSVVQGADGWRVRCTPTQICAVKGSKVQIRCSYWHPSRIDDLDVAVEQTYWFTKGQDSEPVDLRAASEYTGRVQYHCGYKACTLTITDLRESDSDVYQFRFITNQPTGSFTGSPGVSLSVTGVQVISTESSGCRTEDCSWSRVECQTSCSPTPSPSYIWYKNEQKTLGEKSYSAYFYSADSISCAVRGHEDFPSAPVYPDVQVIWSPIGPTLTCHSSCLLSGRPSFVWYKNGTEIHGETFPTFRGFLQPENSYSCAYELHHSSPVCEFTSYIFTSTFPFRFCMYSVSPSGEIMEGSSVTLTCSSDANPAAKYTWSKEDEDSPKASGQIFTI
ncbi:uncharacterized protein LOC124854580, partial [Hippoglossus stenolepis]|uniref:uncharacterized protein LOC124854580 n=1 Tax=Hippoglossus stenolepis TaxID=195615 RepID=UPI001FAEAA84